MSDSLPVIDSQALDALRALSPDDGDVFVKEICSIFVEDTPKRLVELDQTLASGDTAGFVRAAHSIKGSSANLGAAARRSAAEHLETKGRKEGLANVAELVAGVKTEFERAKAEIAKLFP
jgi:HPt (histidine-containing phosphotransfer) domain-containing protein